MSVIWRGVRLDARTRDMMNEVAKLTPSMPTITPTQGSYNTSVSQSAGTHAGGGAIDISVKNLTVGQRDELVRVMRTVGFAAWRRLTTEGNWPEHIHGIAIGCSDLSPAAARQVTAYRNGRNGLANNGPDNGPQVGFTTWEDYNAMPSAQEIALEVWRYKNEKVTDRDAYSHLRRSDPEKALAAEVARVRAEQAAQRELISGLAKNVGTQLTDEQVSALAEAIGTAGQFACDEVLRRLDAVGEALIGDDD